MLNIVLFGPPGAGKGTQSEKIIKKYNLVPIATGDLFRLHLKNNTELGITAKEYMNRGNLVPDEIVINMVEDKINIKGIVNSDDIDKFIELDDTIINLKGGLC